MFFSLFGSIIYSNPYLECYKNISFELNKNVLLKTCDSSFRETHLIRLQTIAVKNSFYFENIKIESNCRFLKIISEFTLRKRTFEKLKFP